MIYKIKKIQNCEIITFWVFKMNDFRNAINIFDMICRMIKTKNLYLCVGETVVCASLNKRIIPPKEHLLGDDI